MDISSIQASGLFQSNCKNKTKTDCGNDFSDVLKAEEVKETASEPVTAKSDEPSYSISEEEAEYFREKYGDEYNEDTAQELFFELSDSNIISKGDARDTLGHSIFQRAEGPLILMDANGNVLGIDMLQGPDGGMVRFDYGYEYLEKLIREGKAKLPKVHHEYTKSYLYQGGTYAEFEQQYGKTVNTWQDYMQKQLDFYNYVIGSDKLPEGGNGRYPGTENKSELNAYLEESRERIQKTYNVIQQIFN